MERELFVCLLDALRRVPGALARPPKCTYRHIDVLAVVLWAALHDRPISWAVERRNWPHHDRVRALPSSATVSRRSRDPVASALLERLIVALRVGSEPSRVLLIDGRPLTIARHSADRDARFGRASGALGNGYKLHEIVDSLGNCRAFAVTALNTHEQRVAAGLIARLEPGEADVLLGDNNYDANALYDLAGARGIQLLAPRRSTARGLGHRRHSPWRLRAVEMLEREPRLLDPRRRIESCFGAQGNAVGGLGPLPNWVRGLRGVTRWVTAKLAIDAAHRERRWQRRRRNDAA